MTINTHEIAEDIKIKVGKLVNHGPEIAGTLERVKSIPDWITLKNESSATILLAMRMYLEGVLDILHREKKL